MYVCIYTHTELMAKLFIPPSILNVFIHFSESNAGIMSVFFKYVNKHNPPPKKQKNRNIKLNFQSKIQQI